MMKIIPIVIFVCLILFIPTSLIKYQFFPTVEKSKPLVHGSDFINPPEGNVYDVFINKMLGFSNIRQRQACVRRPWSALGSTTISVEIKDARSSILSVGENKRECVILDGDFISYGITRPMSSNGSVIPLVKGEVIYTTDTSFVWWIKVITAFLLWSSVLFYLEKMFRTLTFYFNDLPKSIKKLYCGD